MAAIVAGASLGLTNTSLALLGLPGQVGNAAHGASGERVHVNSATGNLVVQNRDELVLGRGPDLSLLRTYNSQGLLNDDNGDNWRLGIYRRVYDLTGTVNTAGSSITRVDADGAELLFSFDAALGNYVSHDGGGAHDTLAFDPAAQVWTFTDGDSRVTERYDAANGGRITQVLDPDGNGLTFTYDAAGLITQVSDASGETTFLDYAGSNLTQLRTVKSDGQTLVRTRYAYDASNRLIQVITDLSPEDASVADANTYVVSYTYDGTSTRIASLTQSDGNNLAFTYVQVGTDWKVASLTHALGRVTTLAYNTTARTTTVTDALGLATVLAYDAAGQLISLTGPAVGGASQVVSYVYDTSGNVTGATDARGNALAYAYDAQGNRVLERDAAGNTVTRTYGSRNELLTETTYLVPDPDGAGAGQPASPLTTRYGYDEKNHLRFVVSAEGRVSEFRYNAFGQQTAAIQYTGDLYSLAGLTPADALTEAQLSSWVGTADKAKSLRVDSTYGFRGQLATTTSYASVDAAGNGVANGTEAVRQYFYDQAGNLLKTIDPRGSATADPNDFTTTYVYDGLGRVLSTVDALGRVTLGQYQDANRKTVLMLANGLVSTSTYDAAGNLVSVLQSSGTTGLGETKYFYDALGRLRRTEDPTGIKIHVLYDEAGRKVGAIDGDGSLTEYRYDAANNPTRTIRYANAVSVVPEGVSLASIRPVASSADRSTWNAYDSANRLVKSVDEAGFVTQRFYDGAGRLTDIVRFASAVSTLALGDTPAASSIAPAAGPNDRLSRSFYDAQGKLRGDLDGEGFLVEYKYDAAGQLVETIGYANATPAPLRATGTLAQLTPAASVSDIHSYLLYNARGQVAGSIDGEGFLTEAVYDAAGNKTQVIRYAAKVNYTAGATLASLRPAASSADQATVFAHDALNRVTSQTAADGTVTQFTYDEVGNLTKTVKAAGTAEARTLTAQFDKQGRLTAELSANGAALLTGNETQAQIDAIWAAHAVRHSYDAAGRRTSTTDANGKRLLFFYNADGALTHTINAAGEVKESVYNALGQLTQTIAYGTRISQATLASLSGGLVNTTLSAVLNMIGNAALDSKTSYAYSLTGGLTLKTDPLGNAVSQAFNAFGEMVSSSQAIGPGQTLDHTYAYDKRGRHTLTRWDPTGINTSAVTVYDAFGRAVQSTDANGNVRSATYDRLGRAVTSTDPLGKVSSTTYDAFDRVLTQTDALGKLTSYSYNTASRSVTVTTPENIAATTVKNRHGETVSITDGRGNTTSYTYDRNGNQLRVDVPAAGANTGSYDAANQLVQSVDANGTATVYSYDAVGRVLTRTVDPGAGHLNLVTTYAYDAKGQAVSVTDPGGVITQTTFDLKGQVVSVVVDPGAGHLNLTTTYSYDARAKTLSVNEGAGSASPRLTQYSYDKLGRLTSERVDPNGINATTTYAYDKNSNVVTRVEASGKPEARTTRYAYDANDRLVYTVDALGGVTRSDYDANGRITKFTAYATPVSLTGLSDAPNLAEIAARVAASALDEAKSYVYDGDGRELFCIDALGGVTQKFYDGNGNVVRKVEYANAIPATTALTSAAVSAALVASANDRATRTVYDAANRAIYIIDSLGYVKQNVYDNAGHIIKTITYARAVDFNNVLANPNAYGGDISGWWGAAAAVTAAQAGFGTEGNAIALTDRDTYGTDWFAVSDGQQFEVSLEAIRALVGDNRSPYDLRIGLVFAPDQASTVSWANVNWIEGARTTANAEGVQSLSSSIVVPTGKRYARLWISIDGPWGSTGKWYFRDVHLRQAGSGAPSLLDQSANPDLQLRRWLVPDAADQIDTFSYDAAGRLVSSTDAGGFTETYAYDALGNKTSFTNKKGATWTYAYDAAGRLVSETSPAVPVTRLQSWTQDFSAGAAGLIWDGLNDPAFMRLENGRVVVQTPSVTPAVWRGLAGDRTYPVASGAIFRAEVNTGQSSAGRSLIIGASNDGVPTPAAYRRLTAYFSGGAVYAHYYDPAANTWPSVQLGTIKDDTTYVVEVLTGASGATLFVYEQGKDRASGFSYTSAFNDWGFARSVMWTLGNTGQPASTMYVDNLSETAAVVTTEAVTTAIAYDALGNVLSRTEASGRPEARTTQYRYDALGRQIKTIFPSVAVYDAAADNLSTNGVTGTVVRTETTIAPEVNVTYDALGDATVNRDTAGSYSYKAYDALGRVRYEIDEERYVTEYGYDRFDNRTTVKRYATALNFGTIAGYAAHADGAAFAATEVAARLAASAGDRTITTTYDALNRATTVVEPTVYTFDSSAPAGSPQYFFAGKTTRSTYNAYGQVIKQSVLKNSGADLSAGTADDTWTDIHFYYDARGNKTAQVDPLGYLTTYQYDETGDLVRQVEYARALAAGTWNTAGYAAPVATTPQSSLGSAIGYDRETAYRYDRKNQRIADTRVNVEYTQDMGLAGGAPVLTRMVGDLTTTYGYDGVGNTVASVDPSGAATYIYYDALGRVTAAVEPARTVEGAEAPVMPLTEYKLDVFGNVVKEIGYAKGAASATASGYERSATDPANDQASHNFYDAHGKIVRSVDPLGNGRYFSYDAMGRTAKEWQPFTHAADGTGGTGVVVGSGLLAEYYDNASSQLKTTRVDPTVNFTWGAGSPDPLVPADNFFVRWSGQVQAPTSETYTFYTTSDDGVRLWVNGTLLIDNWTDHGVTENSGSIALVAGQKYDIRMEYYERGGGAVASLSWSSASQAKQIIPTSQLFAQRAAPVSWAGGREDTAVKVYQYDKTGRETAIVEPAYRLNRSLAASGVTQSFEQRSLSFAIAASEQWFTDEYGAVSWSGSNQVNVAWNAMAAWGGGEVRVDLDYLNLNSQARSYSATVSSVSGDTGTSLVWSGSEGISQVTRVRVSKKDASGNWVLVHDRAASGAYGKSITWTSAAPGSYQAQLKYRLTGAATWSTAAITANFGGRFVADVTALANGAYQYEALQLRSGIADPYAGARGTLTVTGAASATLVNDNSQPSSWTGAINPADFVRSQTRYNAFGEITAKGQNDLWQESFDYDNAGRLWRSNADDGVARTYLYNLDGKATSEFRSQTNNLRAPSIDSPDDVVSMPGNMRTDSYYDALGRVTKQAQAAFSTDVVAPPSSTVNNSLTFGVVSSASPYADEYGPSWLGTNQIDLSWNAMSAWGGGDVRVRVDYINYNTAMGTGVAAFREVVVSSGAGNTGTSIIWSDDAGAPYGGVLGIQRVQVWKKDSAGNWALIHDRAASAGNYGKSLVWQAPTDLTSSIALKYRVPGSATWTSVPVYNLGNSVYASLAGVANNGTYEYEITYKGAGEAAVPYARATGTITSLDSAATSLGFGITSSGQPFADESGFTFWSGSNRVDVTWNPMADWGGGDVQVTIDYMTYNASMGVGVAASQTRVLSSANGNTGAAVSWSDAAGATYGGVQSITRVRVWKKDAAGAWQLTHDRNAAATNYGRVFAWSAPAGTGVQFQYKLQGSSTWSTLPVLNMGSKRIVDLRGLAAGTTYDYQLIYTPAGGASYTQGSGTFTTANGAPEQVTVTPTSNPGLTLVQTPTLSQTLDRWGNTLSVTDPRNAGWITRYRYNYESKLVEEIKPLIDVWGANGASALQSPTVTNFYDKLGRAIGTRDANGNLLTARYDGAGHVKAEYHADGGVVTYGYDLFGRKVRSTDAIGNVTLSTYDRGGRLLRQSRPIGGTAYAYDQLGNRIEESVAADATTNLVTRYWYDSRGKVVRSRLPLESGETAAEAKDTVYSYDSRGNKIREINANGDQPTWSYDYFGRLLAHTDLGGAAYTYAYNKAGQITQQSLIRGTTPATTSYGYYENGLLKKITESAVDFAWMDDAPPAGALLQGDEAWSWVSGSPAPQSGGLAHQSAIRSGTHQHLFTGATDPLQVNAGDTLYAWVYLDPANPPSEVMLQWNDGNWDHRAYWGANNIGWGANGTASRRFMGALPAAGGWVRLEVAASLVGLEGRTVNGIAFTLYGGRATWDKAGKLSASAETFYEYDAAGNRTRERYIKGGVVLEDSRIAYDRQNRIAAVQDAFYKVTYGYDANGNRRYVGATYYDQSANARNLTNWYTYDSMNRVTLSQGVLIGNTIQIANASATAPVNAQDVVVSYDASGNRVATASGSIQVSAAQGVQLYYDAAGNRRIATSYQDGALATDNYAYDANNRLVSTTRGGALTSSRTYDWADRVTEVITFSATDAWRTEINSLTGEVTQPVIKERRVNTYNNKGWLLRQEIYNGSGTLTQRATYGGTPGQNGGGFVDPLRNGEGVFAVTGNGVTGNGYDNLGNLLQYQVSVFTGTSYTNTYRYTYLKYDTYRESRIDGSSTYFNPGATTTAYDVNGTPVSVTETFATNKNRSFVVDGQGHVLAKTENGKTQRYFYVSGMPIGTSGALGPADFDHAAGFARTAVGNVVAITDKAKGAGSAAALTAASFDTSYVPISDFYPAAVPSRYVVSQGDTLRSIALSVYGDAQLWYVIADANGLQGDADLVVGRTLTIPNKVTSVYNSYGTFKPYNPGEIIGDTTPTLPAPPPPRGACGGFGRILVAIVAVVVTVFTAGVAAIALGAVSAGTSVIGAGIGVLSGSIAGAGFAGIAAAAIGGAAGSIASQALAIGLGMQEKFNWGAVAAGALGAAITSGIGAATNGIGIGGQLFGPNTIAAQIVNGAVGNAVSQGVGIITGQQKKFDWLGLAAAAVSAPISAGINKAVSGAMNGGFGGNLAGGFAGGLASGLIRAVFHGGKVDFVGIAADAFGNALGDAIVAQLQEAEQQPEQLRRAVRPVRPAIAQPAPTVEPSENVYTTADILALMANPNVGEAANQAARDPEANPDLLLVADRTGTPPPQLDAAYAAQFFTGLAHQFSREAVTSPLNPLLDLYIASLSTSTEYLGGWLTLEQSPFANRLEALNSFREALAAAGVTPENAAYSAVMLVRQGSTPESLTEEVLYQMGGAFRRLYEGNARVQAYVAELVANRQPGDFMNVTPLWLASAQEAISRAGTSGITIPILRQWADGYVQNFNVAFDDLAPPALRFTSGRDLVLHGVLDTILVFDATKLGIAAVRGATSVALGWGATIRTGFDGLTDAMAAWAGRVLPRTTDDVYDFAVGLARHQDTRSPTMLENFARNVNAHTFKDIYGSWLNWRDFADLAGKIEGALNGARTIRVNLDGLVQSVDDLPRIIELGARGIHFEGVTATGTRMGNITNWEVFTIYTNPALRERAVFYLNGQPVRVP